MKKKRQLRIRTEVQYRDGKDIFEGMGKIYRQITQVKGWGQFTEPSCLPSYKKIVKITSFRLLSFGDRDFFSGMEMKRWVRIFFYKIGFGGGGAVFFSRQNGKRTSFASNAVLVDFRHSISLPFSFIVLSIWRLSLIHISEPTRPY